MLEFNAKAPENVGYSLIEPGTYAVTLSAEWDKTKAGDEYIKLTFKIKKDVEQDFGGRIVFDGIYKDKETKVLKEDKINAILSTVKNPQTHFEDYDELIQYFNGLEMAVDIEIDKANPEDPNAKDKNRIKYCSYKPLVLEASEANVPAAGAQTAQGGQTAQGAQNTADNIKSLDEDDLPF